MLVHTISFKYINYGIVMNCNCIVLSCRPHLTSQLAVVDLTLRWSLRKSSLFGPRLSHCTAKRRRRDLLLFKRRHLSTMMTYLMVSFKSLSNVLASFHSVHDLDPGLRFFSLFSFFIHVYYLAFSSVSWWFSYPDTS